MITAAKEANAISLLKLSSPATTEQTMNGQSAIPMSEQTEPRKEIQREII